MSTAVEVVSAFAAGHEADAAGLVFEYMAVTLAQTSGRAVPSQVSELPRVLKDECASLAVVYRHPGTLLVAYAGGQPAGCVGLAWREGQTAEVKRLYVRPAHRGAGIARDLMARLHRHAAFHGLTRLILDVLPSRVHAIEFYRRLGYTETEPFACASPLPMVSMARAVGPAGIRLS
jgi:ribosomal protein S18 acetylase RimI-like enzyme